jgi:Bacterial transcriptional regulator
MFLDRTSSRRAARYPALTSAVFAATEPPDPRNHTPDCAARMISSVREKLDSLEPLRIYSRIGASVPPHCIAVGKVMLAYMPIDEQPRVLSELDLKRLTPNSVGNLPDLRTELFRVRKNGYATDLENTSCIFAVRRLRSGTTQAVCNRVSASRLRLFVCP